MKFEFIKIFIVMIIVLLFEEALNVEMSFIGRAIVIFIALTIYDFILKEKNENEKF